MYGVFSTYCINNQNQIKLGSHLVSESIKAADEVGGKIKSGFLSLLKSISNSFKCLIKLFSFSKVSNPFNTEQKYHVHLESAPSVAIEEKEDKINDDNSSRAAHQAEFHKLKTEMHAKLGEVFKHRSNG